jgi:hypothetical protein
MKGQGLTTAIRVIMYMRMENELKMILPRARNVQNATPLIRAILPCHL